MSLAQLPVSRNHPARAIRFRHAGEPLVLRPVLMTDAEPLVAAILQSVPELRAYMPWSHLPQTPLGQLERLRTVEADYWAARQLGMLLAREADGTILSIIGLHPRVPLNPLGLELGFWCPTPYARRGYTTLASKVAMLYAFDKLEATRLQVLCDTSNVASTRVITKCGFRPEGTLRNALPPATRDQAANGLRTSGASLLFALIPDDLADLPWVADLRAQLTYVNMAGYEI